MGVCRGPTENDPCPVSELPGPPGHAQAGQVCWYVREDAQFKVDPSYHSTVSDSLLFSVIVEKCGSETLDLGGWCTDVL